MEHRRRPWSLVFAWYLCVLWIVSCVLWGVCNFTDLLQLTPLYDRCASGYYLAGEGDGQTQVKSFPPLKGRPARAWERDTTQFSFIHFSCRLRCRIDYEPYVSTYPMQPCRCLCCIPSPAATPTSISTTSSTSLMFDVTMMIPIISISSNGTCVPLQLFGWPCRRRQWHGSPGWR